MEFINAVDAKVGILWHKLNNAAGKCLTMSEIEGEKPSPEKLSRKDMCIAMGWLINENKLEVFSSGKKILVKLNEGDKNEPKPVERYKRDTVAEHAESILELLKGNEANEAELEFDLSYELKDIWIALGFLLKERRITQRSESNRKLYRVI